MKSKLYSSVMAHSIVKKLSIHFVVPICVFDYCFGRVHGQFVISFTNVELQDCAALLTIE